MARKHAERREENHLIRGFLLEVLHAAVTRERGDVESPATYVDELLLYSKAGRRYPMGREAMRGHLYYLYERGYVKFKDIKIGAEHSLMWRITANGTDLLDGTREDPGVFVG